MRHFGYNGLELQHELYWVFFLHVEIMVMSLTKNIRTQHSIENSKISSVMKSMLHQITN